MSFRPKKTIKSGRRAQQPVDESNDNVADNIIEQSVQQHSADKRQITKGWGEESSFQKRNSQSRNVNKEETILDKDDSDSDREMNIPMIPEASTDEPQIAKAPNVIVNRVSTYKELDRDFSEHVAFTMFEDEIDLKILSHCLLLKSEVEEVDEQWEYDHLFAEVTSDLIGASPKKIA